MNANTRLKSKYTLKRVIFEDMISYCYLGVNDKTNAHLLIWKYKIPIENHPLVQALIQRAEILMGLKHALLLPLIDYAFDGISFYTIHPYIPKLKPLDTFLDTQDSPNLKQRWDIGKTVLQLIELFESHQITCGAISTSSIHMCDNGQCVMIHAGIGILVMQAHIDQLSSSDDCMFLAPELIHKGAFSIASDLYALGVLLYYLFSNSWPYPYTLSLEAHQKSLIGNPRPFHPLSASVPESLSPIIMTCIECDISDRFESASTLQHALQGIIPIKPRSTTNKRSVIQEEIAQSFRSEENKTKRMKRRWLIISVSTGLILTICSYLYYTYVNAIPNQVIPNIIGMPHGNATELLESLSFHQYKVVERHHPAYEKNTVIDIIPPPGRTVKQNRELKLFISSGKAPIYVPDLIGRNKADVDAIISNIDLNLYIITENYSATYPKGTVISQHPSPNTVLVDSEEIGIAISKGFPITVSAQPINFGFFNQRTKRRVHVHYDILPDWPAQHVKVVYEHKSTNILHDMFHKTPEQIDLTYKLEVGGVLSLYVNDDLAHSETIE